MIARCARCQGTFTTDRFGVQTCPHCGSEILLSDPAQAAPPGTPATVTAGTPDAPAAGTPDAPTAAPGEPPWGAPPPMPPPAPGGGFTPPAWPPPPSAAPPPPTGWSDPSGGFSPPPPYGPPPYGGPPGGGPPGTGWPPPLQGELPSPFAERATRGFLPAFFETFKLVATQPAEFFRRVRVDQPGSAILFGVLAATVGSVFAALYAWLSGAASLAAMQEMLQQLPEEQAKFLRLFTQGMTGWMTVLQVVAAPLVALVGIYLNAAVVHLFLLLFRGAPRRFDATLTVVGYATGLQLLLVLPGCGGLVASVWYLVVMIIGLGEAQRCGAGKAAAAVFAPVVLVCACCCAALGVIGAGSAGFLEQLKHAAEAAKGQGTNL
jgi:hypothetical protein